VNKKEAKKLCFLWGGAVGAAIAKGNQKFFAELFFKKATACFPPAPRG
jgi:hypothetical protein